MNDPLLINAGWYWFSYRIIGSNGNGGVEFNAVVTQCEHPPTKDDLGAIERAHEAALQHPGVATAQTIGPIRERKRDFS